MPRGCAIGSAVTIPLDEGLILWTLYGGSACVPQAPDGGSANEESATGASPELDSPSFFSPAADWPPFPLNSSLKSLRSKTSSLPSFSGTSVSTEGTLGTTTCPAHVGQRTTVPALRWAIPRSWLQYAQRNRIGMPNVSRAGSKSSGSEITRPVLLLRLFSLFAYPDSTRKT